MDTLFTKIAFDVLEQIESTTSSNEKKKILNDNIDNNILFNLLYWTYNFNYHYYMNKIDDNIKTYPNDTKMKQNIFDFKKLLAKLNSRKITGNSAKDAVNYFLSSCCDIEQKWYKRVLKRDLRCGISITTINNVYGNKIPIFPVALAENMETIIYPKDFVIEDKFDGYRCIAIKHKDGTVNMFSRNGNELLGYTDIVNELEKLKIPNGEGIVFDGELVSSNFKGTQNTAFKKTNNKKATYNIFDILTLNEFYNNQSDVLKNRITRRNGLLNVNTDNLVNVEYILKYENGTLTLRNDFAQNYKYKKEYKTNDKAFINTVCDSAFLFALDNGLEGIIVKDLNSNYMIGKSYSSTCIDLKNKSEKFYSWTKRKPSDTHDLVVLDVYEGTGINKDKMGGVNVEYIASNGKSYIVGVGSGFKQEDREYYWQNKNDIIGKTIEVVADSESVNSDGDYSLRFPRFKKIRGDK